MSVGASAQQQTSWVTALRRRLGSPDYPLLLVVLGLLAIGLMMVYSATFDWSYQDYGSSFQIASRQFLWAILGLAVMAVISCVPYDVWRRQAVPIMAVTLLSLVLVLIFGDDRFGARRSFLNGSVQPGELVKLTMIIYVAAWLASKGDQVRDVTYGLIPFAVLIGAIAGLIVMQPDMSTAILLVLTAVAMFFFAGADIVQLAIGGLIGGSTLWMLINQMPHARRRIEDYVLTWRDPLHLSYHIQQSLVALGSGGLFGVGLGQGQQKLGYLPAHHTDSIFAVLGEEMGFMGCLAVIGLFVVLAYRGFKIAQGAPDAFAALLACGVTCWLTFQALVNVAVLTGLLPFTGVALPFISFGGSAMLVSMAGVGLLLSISRGRGSGGGKRSGQRPRSSRPRANLDRRRRYGGTRLSGTGRRPTAAR
jgi:cell division protein FtsW